MILYFLYATAFVVVSYLWFVEMPSTKRRWRSINLDARLGRFSQSMEDLWKGKSDDWWWEQYLEEDERKGVDYQISEFRWQLENDTAAIKKRIRSKVGELQKMAVDGNPDPPRGKSGMVRKSSTPHDEGVHLGNGYVLYPNEMRLVMMAGLGQEYDATMFRQDADGDRRVEFIRDGHIHRMDFTGEGLLINTSRKDPRIAPWD